MFKIKESGWADIDTVAGDMIQRAKGVKERGRPEKAERAFHLSGISKRESEREGGWVFDHARRGSRSTTRVAFTWRPLVPKYLSVSKDQCREPTIQLARPST